MQEMTKLRVERLRRGWTLKGLAARTGMSVGDISKFERLLAVPCPVQRKKLARAVQLPPEQLLDVVQVEAA